MHLAKCAAVSYICTYVHRKQCERMLIWETNKLRNIAQKNEKISGRSARNENEIEINKFLYINF